MSASVCRAAAVPTPDGAALAPDPVPGAVPLSSFLDRVAGVLRVGLPDRVWLAATVVEARIAARGHTLELADPALHRDGGTLRVFLASSALAAIRRDFGMAFDPALLVGMTATILIAPAFTRRWHLGGRVEAIGAEAAASLRAKLLERVVATLQRERIWDQQHARPRPRDVTRLAVVHPAGAAGWRDIAGELERWSQAGLVVTRSHPAPFEGDQAAGAIAAALRAAVAPLAGYPPDVVLVVRGGGAKVSLVALDEEIVARAILACPVPVVTGTGHAQDCSLADRVAWRAVDTPSKALALMAGLLRGAARDTVADWDAIRTAAASRVLGEAGRLAALRHGMAASLARSHAAADRQLGTVWALVQAERCGGAARLRAEQAALDRQLDSVVVALPQCLDTAAQALQQVRQAACSRAAALLARADDGSRLLAGTLSEARMTLERQAARLQREADGLHDGLARRLDRETAALDRMLVAIEVADPARILAAGFALVTDADGHLLPSRMAATAHPRLRLRFRDGELEVAPAG